MFQLYSSQQVCFVMDWVRQYGGNYIFDIVFRGVDASNNDDDENVCQTPLKSFIALSY